MCLQSLWVLDLRYTEWNDILFEGNMDIMINLRELNIEGFMSWQLISRLQGRLRYLQKLRIIKPTHKAETTSIDWYNSFMDKIDLKILDLSGNRDMKNLPANLSMAKSLQALITLGGLTRCYAESLHVHDAAISTNITSSYWYRLKWCHVERCPNLDMIFPAKAIDGRNRLQTIWASDLQMARCIWGKGLKSDWYINGSFQNLQHLHLRSCPRLQFALPVWVNSFPSLETLHIFGCGDLTHVFVLDELYSSGIVARGLSFQKLITIHLHDMPKLRQISEVKMIAPALETIRIRGCFGLRRLPALQGRGPRVKRPAVEMEKDVWEALEWDGLTAGHHPSLFEPPVHSRYYRRKRLLRGTVLR
ncbi:putative disease resistance protein At4g10780 [Panicum virgatum]|nr:putative disease resistance protein At4g10780 [Panicum virgatum]